MDLGDCPGREHVEWWLMATSVGATRVAAEAVDDHLSQGFGASPERMVEILQSIAGGSQAVVEVGEWRRSRFADAVVAYRGGDGRACDLVVTVDPTNGKLALARSMRSASGADVGYKDPSELTDDERARVHRVFDAAFRGADHSYLDRTLARMSSIGLGFRDDELLGFCTCTQAELDFPGLGRRIFNDAGLTCVDPGARLSGLSNAIGHMALAGMKAIGMSDFAMLHYATPVTAKATFSFTGGGSGWPGRDVEEWVANYRMSPTANQRAAGQTIARYLQAEEYDDEHWVLIGTGHPLESTALPNLEPEYFELFEHVDLNRGDQLLALFWPQPPPEWWQ
jgi:hypothetical protein